MCLHHDFRHERHFSRVAWWAKDAAELILSIVILGYKFCTSTLEPAYSDSRNLAGSIGTLHLLPLSGQNKFGTLLHGGKHDVHGE